jgi:hypothetical protein
MIFDLSRFDDFYGVEVREVFPKAEFRVGIAHHNQVTESGYPGLQ